MPLSSVCARTNFTLLRRRRERGPYCPLFPCHATFAHVRPSLSRCLAPLSVCRTMLLVRAAVAACVNVVVVRVISIVNRRRYRKARERAAVP